LSAASAHAAPPPSGCLPAHFSLIVFSVCLGIRLALPALTSFYAALAALRAHSLAFSIVRWHGRQAYRGPHRPAHRLCRPLSLLPRGPARSVDCRGRALGLVAIGSLPTRREEGLWQEGMSSPSALLLGALAGVGSAPADFSSKWPAQAARCGSCSAAPPCYDPGSVAMRQGHARLLAHRESRLDC